MAACRHSREQPGGSGPLQRLLSCARILGHFVAFPSGFVTRRMGIAVARHGREAASDWRSTRRPVAWSLRGHCASSRCPGKGPRVDRPMAGNRISMKAQRAVSALWGLRTLRCHARSPAAERPHPSGEMTRCLRARSCSSPRRPSRCVQGSACSPARQGACAGRIESTTSWRP
jgi:hypothetical protein